MTEYHEYRDGEAVTDVLNTHGIVSEEFFASEDAINWQTGIAPGLLRDVADLAEFCYPDPGALDVGLVESPRDENDAPAIVIGRADDDRYLMVAARQDCEAVSDDEQQELTEVSDQ